MSDILSISSKNSSKARKRKKLKRKKEVVERPGESEESSGEELDLTNECHPIGHYINDRPEMINQMFSVIKGNKLKAMLPPILNNWDIEKLKLQCLDQLLGMSEKRIISILEGEVLTSSSESEVSSDEKTDTESESSTEENNEKGQESEKRSAEQQPEEKGKTLLEILELEMRARAIRALLSKDEVIDLTQDEPAAVKIEKREEEAEKTPLEELTEEERLIAEQELRNKLLVKTKRRMEQSGKEQEGEEGELTDRKEDSDVEVILEGKEKQLEIIEIEDSGDEREKNVREKETERQSWKERWLSREGVQKIVKSSKIYGKMKKRLKDKAKESSFEKVVDESTPEVAPSAAVAVIGSVEEYSRLREATLESLSSKDEEEKIGGENSGTVNRKEEKKDKGEEKMDCVKQKEADSVEKSRGRT